MSTEESLETLVRNASLRIINKKHSAFIGSIIYQIDFKEKLDIGTIQLDTSNLTVNINTDWFRELSTEERAGALTHQILHLALMHAQRQGKRDPERYQNACDQVVNNLLQDMGYTLPSDVEVETKYRNMSVEAVYKYMEEHELDPNNNNSLGNDLLPPTDQNGSNTGSSTPQSQKNKLASLINSANTLEQATTGYSMGKDHDEFKSLFNIIKNGTLDWKSILWEYVNEITQGEYSWRNFSRRHLPMDLYYPTNQDENTIERAAIALDVSGSVSEDEIEYLLTEMKAIQSNINCEELEVITFNTDIVDKFTVRNSDDFSEVELRISGGTDLYPVFEYYKEKHPKFLIVFSDLECEPIEKETPFPVIWICLNNSEARVNFGKLIHVDSEEIQDN